MLRGIFAPIPTPFVDEEVAYDKLAGNLEKWGRTGLAGVVVMGSNGEAPYLEEDEKVELWAFNQEAFPQGQDGHRGDRTGDDQSHYPAHSKGGGRRSQRSPGH